MASSSLADDLRDADSSVLLVPSRVLRRVIKRHRRLPGLGYDVPHAQSYLIPRDALLRFAEEGELGRERAGLPESVILLPEPEPDDPAPFGDLSTRYWRGSFHAHVHRALDARALTAAAVRARVHRVGQTEFDEARIVLRQDRLLFPPHDDRSTYAEFVATYLELRAFAPEQLRRTFPALGDLDAIDRAIAIDVDWVRLLGACRPRGAAPLTEILTRAEATTQRASLSHPQVEELAPLTARPRAREAREVEDEDAASLLPEARAAQAKGNTIRTVLLRTRAAAIGQHPGADAGASDAVVRTELVALMTRLAKALRWDRAPVAQWVATLMPLVAAAPSARRVPWNTEARLLYDLQNACIDAERESYTVDAITWARSLFRIPLRRALPVRRDVRVVAHLNAALHKMPRTYVVEPARSLLAHLLRQWAVRAGENLHAIARPKIEAALAAVSLSPANAPERVASNKIVHELADLIVERGFLSLGQLRDALSRNRLKLPNLTLRELVFGDALMRADDLLSRSLDGVYRRGEIYLRALHRLSSVAFGTRVGRLLTLFVFLPLGGAYVGLAGVTHMLGAFMHYVLRTPDGEELNLLHPVSFAITAVTIFALMHSAPARVLALRALAVVGATLSAVLFRAPRWFFTRPIVQRFLGSRPVALLGRYLVKPLAITALGLPVTLALALPTAVFVGVNAAAFALWNLVLNSRAGGRLEEAAADAAARAWRELHQRVLPGIAALLVAFFQRFLDGVDRMIYTVDEWLRFHRGEHAGAIAAKAVLGFVWFFATYVLRIYVNLLIEPQVNPIKHFPVVTVAAKIMLPMIGEIRQGLTLAIEPILGQRAAHALALPTAFLLPGFWGFLVWELKENFKLYRMNRSAHLVPVAIGHHGESMAAYLKPGLHSGTIPKLYAKLRRAARAEARSTVRYKHALLHVEETIKEFAARQLVALLVASARWNVGDVGDIEVGDVTIASNRVRVELRCPAVGADSAYLAFEEQSGQLLASVTQAGFIDALSDEDRITFETALAGLYAMAGVDLVREQIAACLTGSLAGAAYDVSSEGLVVWPGADRSSYATEVVYALGPGLALHGVVREGEPSALPVLDARALVFARTRIAWTTWVDVWSARADGAPPPRVVYGPSLLPPRSEMPVALTVA